MLRRLGSLSLSLSPSLTFLLFLSLSFSLSHEPQALVLVRIVCRLLHHRHHLSGLHGTIPLRARRKLSLTWCSSSGGQSQSQSSGLASPSVLSFRWSLLLAHFEFTLARQMQPRYLREEIVIYLGLECPGKHERHITDPPQTRTSRDAASVP